MSALERFMRKVRKQAKEQVAGLGPCWYWRGALRTNGYGHFSYTDPATGKTRWRGAHQWSWELLNGPIPEGMVLMHKCDKEICVNPSHLEPGTPKQNMDDKMAKGRSSVPRKLNPRRVRHIRRAFENGVPVRELAKRFDLRFQTVYRVVKRQSWKDIA